MSRWNVIIAALDEAQPLAADVAQRLGQHWPVDPGPKIRCAALSELTSDRLASVDLVILTAGSIVERTAVMSCLTAIEQANVGLLGIVEPTLEINTTVKYAGGLMMPPELTDEVLCATAMGLLHRQGDFRQVHQELSIAQRFHGGLEGEIARMHEELQLAAMVQREMLPRSVPSLGGVSFAAMWRPANYVSGDIYDICQLDDEHIGVFITDAVGHGVPAALMTMIISRSLHMTETKAGVTKIIEPSRVLSRLNSELLMRQGQTTRFATGIYAVVNCRTRHCTLAGAGHPPPLLLRADGGEQLLETNGGLLGVFSDETYDQIELELHDGDRMLLYSDGFEQAFPNTTSDVYEQRLPTTRYREEFEQLAHLNDPTQVINHIRERLDEQQGSLHQIDDLTLICMNISKPQRPTLKSETDRLFSGRA